MGMLFATYRCYLSTARWFRSIHASWLADCDAGIPQALHRDEAYLLDHASTWWDRAMVVKAEIRAMAI